MNNQTFSIRKTPSRTTSYELLRKFYPQLPKELSVKAIDKMIYTMIEAKSNK